MAAVAITTTLPSTTFPAAAATISAITISIFSVASGAAAHSARIVRWFDEHAMKPRDGGLHTLSAWDYLTPQAYDEMVFDGLRRLSPPIRPGASVFELGCGVGAVFKVIQAHIGEVRPGGCDMSVNAIRVVHKLFPSARSQFVIGPMVGLGGNMPNHSFDHVISFGAMAMYLLKDEMALTMREAVRLAKPGASLGFTHFIEEGAAPRGTIVQPIRRSELSHLAKLAGLIDVRFFQMRHQGKRYMMTSRTPGSPDTPPSQHTASGSHPKWRPMVRGEPR
eukprot:CAMPEP_0119310550 /NCGR_PEP_ID=MMETSP1333-20130426/19631_1 /TAXON_ID=418940 /ORGANISM="Scyphosphaera apsteinii, Strain RCC1455" /LENGTH=277 /DNA_ID=CAMNT_0007314751 /DNA_START=379 /DNA_END=1213 /DNA_ORIENTATION=-